MSSNCNQKNEFGQGDYLFVHKQRGETLACLLRRIRAEQSIGDSVPITYAGRLDPMAEGIVLLLQGEECKKKQHYLGCDKTYAFTILLGVATDTGDVLGGIEKNTSVAVPTKEDVERAMEQVRTQTQWPYPAFSSKTVDGTPLFVHARKGTLPNILPSREAYVYTSACIGIEQCIPSVLAPVVCADIAKVSGDFRQQECINSWNGWGRSTADGVLIHCTATVSSGLYIRTFAMRIAEVLGTIGCAYRIDRTAIHIKNTMTL